MRRATRPTDVYRSVSFLFYLHFRSHIIYLFRVVLTSRNLASQCKNLCVCFHHFLDSLFMAHIARTTISFCRLTQYAWLPGDYYSFLFVTIFFCPLSVFSVLGSRIFFARSREFMFIFFVCLLLMNYGIILSFAFDMNSLLACIICVGCLARCVSVTIIVAGEVFAHHSII